MALTISATAMPAMNVTTTLSPSRSEAAAAKIAYLTSKFHVLQVFLLTGYGTMFLLCALLIIYMRHNRNVALRGDASAARKIILPAFEPLLWILGGATGIYTAFFTTALAANMYTSQISRLSTEFFYCGRQFVFVSVVVFLFQKSVSIPALRRTLFVSFMLSTYTIPIVWYLGNSKKAADFYVVLMAARALLLVMYAYLLIRPPARASKRTIREFCAYAFVYYALLYVYTEMFRRIQLDTGFIFAYANILWGSLCPLVIYRVLKADTEHWRGLGQRAVALQGLFRQRRSALDERISSQGFHLLIEMHRKFIIDFAYLEIRHQIGEGASASVFHGVLYSKTHVAVKVYTPTEFDEETVATFSHEAALCGALHHPNIVKFYGMCVCPPTIGLVSELCDGSLDDVLNAAQLRRYLDPERQQFLLNLGYMLDAARAVAYLHSFSPPFVHRDIKPTNFLVDSKGTVKLTDFGESRSLPRPGGPALHPYMALASGAYVDQHGRYSSSANNRRLSSSGGPGSSTASMSASGTGLGLTSVNSSSMTVRGTVDYMAPEVINGRAGVAAYGEAADIYSLAITMWDILNPGREKFPTLRNNHLQIFESVIEGKRPVLDEFTHPSLCEVIESAWQSDVRLRPSAQHIVAILENIQEEVQAIFALQLVDAMETQPAVAPPTSARRPRTSSSLAECSFTGAEAVAHMQDSGYVASTREAVRMGNALMDAGLMHHLQHTRGFDDDEAELYYFDEDNITLCQPLGRGRKSHVIDVVEEEEKHGEERSGERLSPVYTASSSSDLENNSVSSSSRSNRSSRGKRQRKMERRPLLEQHGLCACRKLGQHIGKTRSSRGDKRKKRSQKLTTKIGTIMEEITSTGLTRSLLTEDDDDRDSEVATRRQGHVAVTNHGPAAAS